MKADFLEKVKKITIKEIPKTTYSDDKGSINNNYGSHSMWKQYSLF